MWDLKISFRMRRKIDCKNTQKYCTHIHL